MTCFYPHCEPGRFGTTCKPECVPKDRATVPAHAEGCWSWGPRHYLCALNEITRLKTLIDESDD